MPGILLKARALGGVFGRVGEHPVVRMAAADARRLHRARRREVGRAEAHALHARRSGGDRLDIVDALRRLQNRVHQDRALEAVARFEQRQILVDEMNVPVALDLGDHHHVELVADLADEPRHIVDEPGRIERVDARPKSGRAEIGRLRHRDQAVPGRLFRVDRNRILEIAKDDVDLADQFGRLRAHLLVVRRYEMDHALKPRGQLEQRARRPDRQRIEIPTGSFHQRRRRPIQSRYGIGRFCLRGNSLVEGASSRTPSVNLTFRISRLLRDKTSLSRQIPRAELKLHKPARCLMPVVFTRGAGGLTQTCELRQTVGPSACRHSVLIAFCATAAATSR